MTWLKVADTVRYHVQIAEDIGFQHLAIDRDDIQAQQFSAPELDFKSYFFRVSSIAEDGYEGVFSEAIPFAVIPPPPAPTLEEPAMVDEETLRFRWKDLGPSIRYHVQVAKDKEFKEIVIEEELTKPELTMPTPEKSGDYYIRTSAMDAKGYEGTFSQPQSFTVEGSLLITGLSFLGMIAFILIL